MIRRKIVVAAGLTAALIVTAPDSTRVSAQAPATPAPQLAPAPWRFAGARPCVGPEGGVLKCPPAARTLAVRAGRLFDSVTGQMLTKQVVLSPASASPRSDRKVRSRIPAGAPVHRSEPGDGACPG